MFRLKLLGSLSLHLDGGPVPPAARQKKRIGLLALLAIGEGRGLSRDRIQAYLWPESDATRARHALDQLVYATRRSLGADPIISEGGELRLDPIVIWTDVRAFEDAVTAGDLDGALSLYSGPLLDGFHISDSRELEGWIDGERARLAALQAKSLETLARDAEAAGDHGQALAYWRRCALADPLSSRIALSVMRALERAGDRAGALQHARSYEEQVRSDLGVAADPEVRGLARSLASALATRTPPGTPVLVPEAGAIRVSPSPAEVSRERVGVEARPSQWRKAAAVAAIAVVILGIAGVAARYQGARHADIEVTRAEAKHFYLSGVNAWNDRSKDALDSAVVRFRRAVEVDPLYADAHAGLANAYVMIGYSGYRPAAAMFPKSKAAALRSIALDSTKAAPYAALGMELTWERKFDDAERAFRRSLSLDPGYATAHQWYGILLMIVGRRDESVAELKRAAELDPLSLQIQNNYAAFMNAVGDRAGALRHYRKVIEEEPDSAWVNRNPWLLTNIASAYAASGEMDRALRAAEQAVKILPGHPRAVGSLAGVYRQMGDMEKARAINATADSTNEHYAAYRAFWHVNTGELDSAFVWFDRVKEWGIPIMISMRNVGGPEVKRDARYVALLRRIGMPVLAESGRRLD